VSSSKISRTIVHLVHRLTVGGAEKVLVNLINGSSAQLRHVVCSFFPADDFENEIDPERRFVVNLHKKQGNDVSIPQKIVKVCQKYQADVVHCQGWGTYFEGLLAAKVLQRHCRFIFAFRGKTVEDLGGVPLRRIWAQKIGTFFSDAIITPSEEMRLDYARLIGFDKEKITVISNGVDTGLFCPAPDRAESKTHFGIPESAVVVGCVARFDPVKNLPGLLQAFADCHKTFPTSHLLLVGDGSQMSTVREVIKQNGLEDVVTLTGRRTDVFRCLQAMNIYVQPSLYEGLSNTILEAMSTALPIIAQDVGGTREVVKDTINGFLLPPESKVGFVDAMASLLRDKQERQNMGLAGREIIEERFSMEKMVQSYDKLFTDV